jgi:hypothetical protein
MQALEWRAAPQSTGESAFSRRIRSGILTLGSEFCLIAWLVTYSPRLVAILQALWPEQIAVLGYIGWQTFGACYLPPGSRPAALPGPFRPLVAQR